MAVLPSYYYRDPAEVVERLQMRRLGCRACASHKELLGRVMCSDERNQMQSGVPVVGDRCKWFIERR